jgi:hypothetical protein
MKFKSGDIVICVNPDDYLGQWKFLKKGKVYIIDRLNYAHEENSEYYLKGMPEQAGSFFAYRFEKLNIKYLELAQLLYED